MFSHTEDVRLLLVRAPATPLTTPPPPPNPGPARLPQTQMQAGAPQPSPHRTPTLIARRPVDVHLRDLRRREARAARLGLGTLHEVQKRHPRDWANPGRMSVQLKCDGRSANERIKTKKQLLEVITFYIQTIKFELTPKPPFGTPSSSGAPDASASTAAKPPPAPKSKQGAPKPSTKGKGKAPDRAKDKDNARTAARARLPQPPEPQSPLARRVSAYSPALPSGVLVDTVMAGLRARGGAPPGAGGKGKRKVVRVRG
ncbi:signal recognition particle, SRP19 subunit [Phellopilus nigrolimitatus]|nr:signal recognition particle, SRP19 subunit [Phellopilus nigrolimitatus]